MRWAVRLRERQDLWSRSRPSCGCERRWGSKWGSIWAASVARNGAMILPALCSTAIPRSSSSSRTRARCLPSRTTTMPETRLRPTPRFSAPPCTPTPLGCGGFASITSTSRKRAVFLISFARRTTTPCLPSWPSVPHSLHCSPTLRSTKSGTRSSTSARTCCTHIGRTARPPRLLVNSSCQRRSRRCLFVFLGCSNRRHLGACNRLLRWML
mmetsp:Transcript_242/g.722  ORF Transcript_242/g.722 Transcript_242/m.722 type:complete len:211 (-) Transcript_242:1766-2398(-)